MKPRSLVGAFAILVAATAAHAAEEGFTSILNGRDLDGWEGNPALWSVQDGAITGQTKADTGLKHNTFLVWKGGTVDDFELRLSYRIVNGNSGIQYRSRVAEQGPQGPIVGGYQADFEAGKTYSGILYEERGRGILAQRGEKTRIVSADGGKHKVEVTGTVGASDAIQGAIKSEDWNDYVVVARGNHLVHTINGRTTVDVTDEDAAHAAKSGVLAFQVHVGPPMTVQFKNVRIKKLAGGESAGGSDVDRMQGEWRAVAGRREGENLPEDWLASLRLTIKGDKYEIAWTDGGDTGSLKLRDGTTPKQMDISSDGAGPVPGIYEFRDGQMRVAYATEGGERPKNFDATPGSGSVAVTYRRK